MVSKDGKRCGPGACDMKGCCAVIMILGSTSLTMLSRTMSQWGCTGVPPFTQLSSEGTFRFGLLPGWYERELWGNNGFYQGRELVRENVIHSCLALKRTSCNAIEYSVLVSPKSSRLSLTHIGPRVVERDFPPSPASR